MDWHYAEGGERKGPVSEEEFQQLVSSGVITSDTLVWQAGMENWLPYGQVSGDASGPSGAMGTTTCAECGQAFPPEDVISLGGVSVCGTCKPIALQRMKEGAALPGQLVLAGFWARFAAKFLDNLILQIPFQVLTIAVVGGLTSSMGEETAAAVSIIISLSYYPVWALYSIFFIGKYGQTPGKMALKIKVVTPDGEKVSYGRAAGRWGAEILSALTCSIGYIIAAFDEEKRALHDHLAKTRVVKVV